MFFVRHLVAAGLLSFAVTAMFGTGAVAVWLELRTMGEEAEVLTLRAAAARALESRGRQVWVSISDGEWLQETLQHSTHSSDSDRRTEVVVTDAARNDFVFAEFLGYLSWEEVSKRSPSGLLSPMSEKRYETFVASAGLTPSEAPPRERMFCLWTEGSRQDSESLLILMTFFTVLGASLFPLCVWARRKWVLPHRAEIAALTGENRLVDAADGDLPETPRVYRLNRSWRTVNILAAVLFLGTAAALLAGVCLQNSAWGGQAYSAWDYGISCVIFLFLLAFGVLGLTTVVTSKVVVSRDGIAYHTFLGIVEADWGDWFDVQLDENDVESGVSMSVRPLHPKVTLRRWTSCLPWDVRRNMIENGIAVSRFGDANGLRLRQDIQNCLTAAAKQHEGTLAVGVMPGLRAQQL